MRVRQPHNYGLVKQSREGATSTSLKRLAPTWAGPALMLIGLILFVTGFRASQDAREARLDSQGAEQTLQTVVAVPSTL